MFSIAGKEYRTTQNLTHAEEARYVSEWAYPFVGTVYRDVYGRRVIHLDQKFPCFDVYDSLYENRYYHWYFIAHEDGIAMLYTADDREDVEITEDIDASEAEDVGEDMRRELELSGLLAG